MKRRQVTAWGPSYFSSALVAEWWRWGSFEPWATRNGLAMEQDQAWTVFGGIVFKRLVAFLGIWGA